MESIFLAMLTFTLAANVINTNRKNKTSIPVYFQVRRCISSAAIMYINFFCAFNSTTSDVHSTETQAL